MKTQKFAGLSVQIMNAIDQEVLKANWEHQLAHQISNLPPIESFLVDLEDALAWWLEPNIAKPNPAPMPQAKGHIVPRTFFPTVGRLIGSSLAMEQIRRAAHNKQCALISYHGNKRLVEPYSLRHPSTGNEILYVHEIEKDGISIDAPRQYKTHEIDSASISDRAFTPKWAIEL